MGARFCASHRVSPANLTLILTPSTRDLKSQSLHKMSTTKRSFKRPFQPSISFNFGHRTCDRGPPPCAAQTSTPLPATVQSSLLNVGMRVRKSVPEGYQTQQKLPFTPERDTVNLSSDFTTLVPYCGIFKIGCHETKPPPCEEDLPPLKFDSDDWGFLSSQESSASSDSLQPTVTVPVVSNHKRRREDDDDDLEFESQPDSPRSYPPFSHTRMPNLDRLRPIALPKTRKKPIPEPSELTMIDVGDFREAEFFRPEEWGSDWDCADET